MGRDRISVRFSPEEMAAVERAARVAGVATGALVRQCAVRWGAHLAGELAASRVSGMPVGKMRRRSGVRAVTPYGPSR